MESNGTYAAPGSGRRLLALLIAVAAAAACALVPGADGRYPELARYAGREIADVRFVDTGPFSADTLEDLVETEPTRCSLLGLPICIPGTGIGREVHRLDLGVLSEDVRRIRLFYRASGYYGTDVTPDVAPEGREADADVVVTFAIRPGAPVYLETLRVEGTEPVLDPDSIERTLPLQPGELFDLGELVASADTVRQALLERGYAYAEALRSFTVDTVRDRATASIAAVPGPLVIVDTIVVVGTESMGRRTTLRQLTFREGDIVRRSALRESQRNLYALELVQIASVTLGADTAARGDVLAAPPEDAPLPPEDAPAPPPGLTPADTLPETIVVTIVEAPVHVVDAVVGFGTVECLRTQAQWVSRNFRGGARRLSLTASVSKIGIGSGFDGSLCDAFEGDPFRTELDYRFAAELTQPWLFSPRNRLSALAFVERQSEPALFQRVARGGRVGVLRRLRPQEFLTAAVDVQRGRTRATPALFCLAFLVCMPEDIAELQQARWRNTLSVGWVRDRLQLPLDPRSGYALRTSGAWAAPWLGSDLDYVRWTGQGAVHGPLRPDWTLAGRLELGSFFGTATLDPGDDFLPPEDRLFAGGPNTVRGFGRNQLGPGVYVFDLALPDTITEVPDTIPEEEVRFVPTGGTSVDRKSVV